MEEKTLPTLRECGLLRPHLGARSQGRGLVSKCLVVRHLAGLSLKESDRLVLLLFYHRRGHGQTSSYCNWLCIQGTLREGVKLKQAP